MHHEIPDSDDQSALKQDNSEEESFLSLMQDKMMGVYN